MAIPLSNLANNLAQRIHKIEYQHGNVNEKCEPCGIKYKYCNCCFEHTNFKDDLIEYKCFCFSKNYQKKFDENLKKQFVDAYKFSNHDINNILMLLLQKRVYPGKYMDDWKKFDETSLPEKEDTVT